MMASRTALILKSSNSWIYCHHTFCPFTSSASRSRVIFGASGNGLHTSVFSNFESRELTMSISKLSRVLGRKSRGISGSRKFSSIKAEEVGKFERMSGSWWNSSASGQMKELHSMNKLRVPFIRDGILQQRETSTERNGKNVPLPLEGFQILDVGCGGGILCEPLGRLGAVVKGIDPGQENITAALNHLPEELEHRVSYQCISIEDLASNSSEKETKYDAIVMSEVIEHVENPEDFIKTAVEVLKPGGSLFLTTLNRTMESWVGAIMAWEYLLRKLPVGTHDWRKFLTPQEIERIFKTCGLSTVLIHGMCYNPINNSWRWSNQRAINYAMHAVKIG